MTNFEKKKLITIFYLIKYFQKVKKLIRKVKAKEK